MDLEELSARLGSLEQARADDLQQAAQQAFMDKYGSRISNNKGLGLVILNELNRRGIDTSAADEAVQEILGNLRNEANMLLDTIKDNMNTANALIDKIDGMDQSVQTAALATGADTSVPTSELMGDIPMDQPPMDMPPDASMPPDTGMQLMDQPPMDQPPMDMPPAGVVSDIRLKFIKKIVSDNRAKKIVKSNKTKQVKPKSHGISFSSSILDACREV